MDANNKPPFPGQVEFQVGAGNRDSSAIACPSGQHRKKLKAKSPDSEGRPAGKFFFGQRVTADINRAVYL